MFLKPLRFHYTTFQAKIYLKCDKSDPKTFLVGGTGGYFPDEATGGSGKPWSNESPTAMGDFFNAKVNSTLQCSKLTPPVLYFLQCKGKFNATVL